MGKEESPCLKVKQFKEIALKKFNFIHCVNSVLACKSDEFQWGPVCVVFIDYY